MSRHGSKPPSSGGYEVGYGKPPKHSQFKKGMSGNAAGRPKKAKAGPEDPIAIMASIMADKVTVMKNGEPTTMTMVRVIAEKIIADAASGNVRNLKQRLDFLERVVPQQEPAEPDEKDPPIDYTASLRAKLEDYHQRQQERKRVDKERKRQGLPPLYEKEDEDDE